MLPGAGAALLAGEPPLLGVGGGDAEERTVATKGGTGAGTLVLTTLEVGSDNAAR
jgi:hypothetical protein